jgi:hypothetical protein
MIRKQRPGKATVVGFIDNRAQPVSEVVAANIVSRDMPLSDCSGNHMLCGSRASIPAFRGRFDRCHIFKKNKTEKLKVALSGLYRLSMT